MLAAGGSTLTDTMHIVWSIVTVFLILFEIGFGAAALGMRFRLYSIATMVVFAVFGTLTFWEASDVGANLPTPWLGVWVSINDAGLHALGGGAVHQPPASRDGAGRAVSGPASGITGRRRMPEHP